MLINYTTKDNADATPPDRAPMVLGFNVTLLAVAVLFVSLRLLVKGKHGRLAIEDALIVISTIITITLVVMTAVATRYGLTRHLVDIHPEWWPTYSKFSFAFTAIGGTCYPLTKLSMLFFYLRLAPHPTYRKVCFSTIGYIAVSSTIITLINLFHCNPVRGGWDHDPALGAKCYDPSIFYYVYSSLNVVTDILLVAIPIPILLKLQLRPKVKIGLVVMFAGGISNTAISAYGVHAMYATYHSSDFTWDGVYSWMWALAEFNTGIIIACMPSMLMFIRWMRGDLADSKKSSSSGSHNMNATFGSGGGSGARPSRKFSLNKGAAEIHTRISHGHGSEEYIMQEMGGIVKSTELVVVETATPGWERERERERERDGGSMC